jgi:hypothetical protein
MHYKTQAVIDAVASGNPMAITEQIRARDKAAKARIHPDECVKTDSHENPPNRACVGCGELVGSTHKADCRLSFIRSSYVGIEDCNAHTNTLHPESFCDTLEANSYPPEKVDGTSEYKVWVEYKGVLYELGKQYLDPNGTEKRDVEVLIAGLVAKVMELEQVVETLRYQRSE